MNANRYCGTTNEKFQNVTLNLVISRELNQTSVNWSRVNHRVHCAECNRRNGQTRDFFMHIYMYFSVAFVDYSILVKS